MLKLVAGNNHKLLSRFPAASGLLKSVVALIAMGICTAAIPAHAGSVPDGDDDPYSDELSQPVQSGADATFANLFSSWRKLDNPGAATAAVYVPTGRPVEQLELTSNFGVRADPFSGRARMHKGIDIPGPVGTPIYATADGIVSRSERMSGYGNLVEIAHGNDMQTRYGHLSKLMVKPNERVRRGQIIGLMGSTGRSTGSHLHYEIRVAGAAINPLPYVTGSERAMALNTRARVAIGGPTPGEEKAAK